MFNSCILRLYQFTGAYDAGTSKRVEIKLQRPHAIVSEDPVQVVEQWFTTQEWHFWGHWSFQPLLDGRDPGLGLRAIPADQRLWLLNVTNRDLAFVAAGTEVGGGLKFGEEKKVLGDDKPLCVLYDAGLTSRGIVIMRDSRPPRGTERMAGGFWQYNSLVLNAGYVFWALMDDYYP